MFKTFKNALQDRISFLLSKSQVLYVVDVDKERMWETYLQMYPEAERQEHNCNACKSFIRHYGGLVSIIDNKMHSIWEFACAEPFQTVVMALDNIVKESDIVDQFFTNERKMGLDKNRQMVEGQPVITWEHLFYELPKAMVTQGAASIDTLKGAARDNRNVFKRALDEITIDAVETVLDLIAQNSLYRGVEYQFSIQEFLRLKREYSKMPIDQRENYAWIIAASNTGSVSKIRNTAIGTLLTDVSQGKDLDHAVSSFERIMAPSNYKRPNAIISKKMIEEAEKTIETLGYANSLGRRFARVDDLTVNNLLFVDRDVRAKAEGLLAGLKDTVPVTVNPKSLSKMEEVPVNRFLSEILPTCTSLEVLFENRHINSLVSLITANDANAPSPFKWNNAFSWSYKDAVTDSLKEKVKAAGGNTEGELRVSLEWFNYDDLDLHVIEPNGQEIYFRDKVSTSHGELDVDMNAGSAKSRTPVENIIWPTQSRMKEGNYQIFVNQYSNRETIDTGFSLEVECQGKILHFASDKQVRGKILVATVNYSKTLGITVIASIGHSEKVNTKTVWGIETNKFHKASMIMQSPNMWNGKTIGNAHLFFIIDQAHNDETVRGFFNEFLKDELTIHKRVFEALGSRSKVEPADKQVSGLGFSSTNHGDVIVKVAGSFNRMIKIKF